MKMLLQHILTVQQSEPSLPSACRHQVLESSLLYTCTCGGTGVWLAPPQPALISLSLEPDYFRGEVGIGG